MRGKRTGPWQTQTQLAAASYCLRAIGQGPRRLLLLLAVQLPTELPRTRMRVAHGSVAQGRPGRGNGRAQMVVVGRATGAGNRKGRGGQDKEARAVHGEPRRKTRNEGETVKRDGLMQIKILWRRESYLVAMIFARDVIRVGWRRH